MASSILKLTITAFLFGGTILVLAITENVFAGIGYFICGLIMMFLCLPSIFRILKLLGFEIETNGADFNNSSVNQNSDWEDDLEDNNPTIYSVRYEYLEGNIYHIDNDV